MNCRAICICILVTLTLFRGWQWNVTELGRANGVQKSFYKYTISRTLGCTVHGTTIWILAQCSTSTEYTHTWQKHTFSYIPDTTVKICYHPAENVACMGYKLTMSWARRSQDAMASVKTPWETMVAASREKVFSASLSLAYVDVAT
jgi:hypothetical protein